MNRPESSNPTSVASPSPTRCRSPLPIGAATLLLALTIGATPASAAGTQPVVVASVFKTLMSSDLTGVVLTFVMLTVGYLVTGIRSRRFRDRRPGSSERHAAGRVGPRWSALLPRSAKIDPAAAAGDLGPYHALVTPGPRWPALRCRRNRHDRATAHR